jgi:hypothetical protein
MKGDSRPAPNVKSYNNHGGFRPLAGKWDESVLVHTHMTEKDMKVSVPLRGSGMKVNSSTRFLTIDCQLFPSPCGEVG